MSETRPLWLVGMMGAGKSTLGPLIATRLRRGFVDCDEEIARRAGCTVAEIFAAEGETGFRAREAELIASLHGGDIVVALGGGALVQQSVRERLLKSGIVVYLEASPECLVDRVGDAEGRPLLQGRSADERLARIRELLAERQADYQRAHLTLNTEDWDVETLVAQVEKHLEHVQGEAEEEA